MGVAIAVLAISPAVAGAISFSGPTNFGTGNLPSSVATGDFNKDGKKDLAVGNQFSNDVTVRLGAGDGTFATQPAGSPYAVGGSGGAGPKSVAVGDFNRDEKQDLAVSNADNDNVSILLGVGNGTFNAKTDFTTGATPRSVAVGDFNRDGKQDLATANQGGGNVSVLLGTGTGTFNPKNDFSVGSAPLSVAIGDFNNDGKQDLSTANSNDDTVSVLLGNGTGTTFTTASTPGAGDAPYSIAVGDFNRDGKSDLAVANLVSGNVSVLIGVGNGTFGSATNFGAGDIPTGVAIGDFDNNGKQDLAVSNQSSQNVSVLLGNGSGSFGTKTDFSIGGNATSIAVADFNNDGAKDLAAGNASGNTVSVLLGQLSPASTAFSGPTNFTVNNGSSAPFAVAVGDWNRNGNQDIATANAVSESVSWQMGDGTGSFGGALNNVFPTDSTPESLAVGDFNKDGAQDLAVANAAFSGGGQNTVAVLFGDSACPGGNCFPISGRYSFPTGNLPQTVAVGDFNKDGNQDLVVGNNLGGSVSVLLGSGTGSFGAFGAKTDFPIQGSNTHLRSVAVGDFNKDGNPDIVAATTDTDNVSVLLGTGTGSFGTKTDFGAGDGPTSVATADLDKDGDKDLAVTNQSSQNVSVLLGTGTGTFGTKTDFTVGNSPQSIAIADLNNNGVKDLAVANSTSDNVSVLLGTGTGSFGTKTDFGAGDGPQSIAAGDFDKNGIKDLVTANLNSGNVSVLLGKATPTISTSATASATVGSSISDTATLAGGANPTGDITFRIYGPNDGTCALAIDTSTPVSVAGNGNYNSPGFTPSTVGTYRWRAFYSGDSSNLAVSGPCNAANESSEATQATPTISTSATASVTIGNPISDTATLAGAHNPTGNITFDVYGPDDAGCTGSPDFTSTVAISGSGATSGNITPTALGTYRWRASYPGDFNNAAVSGPCNAANENSVVTQATPTISTSATASVTIGNPISDTATLAGAHNPTGTITFLVWGPDNATCNGAPDFSVGSPVSGSSASSGNITPTAPGTYRWRASYPGDANNAAVSGPCNAANENSVVQATPTISTSATASVTLGNSISDTATLASGNNPTGNITFEVYGPDNATCAGSPDFTSVVPISGSGATSGNITPTAPGTYRWRAFYFGDTNNAAVSGACNATGETSVVQATPTISTSATVSATIGSSISDQATLAAGHNPTGNITFSVYGPDDATCATAVHTSSPVTVSGNATYSSPTPAFTPAAVGVYRWRAFYSGDANNAAVSGPCGAANETSTLAQATPTISTQATANVTIGSSISDQATLAAGHNPTGNITFSVYGPDDATCATAVHTSSPVTVSGNATYSSPTPAFTPTAVGVYRWRAFYSGDANNAAVSGPCGAANETSTLAQATPTISTQATANVTIGSSISDQATLAAGHNPTGNITFSVYGPDDATCATAVHTSSPVTVSGNATYSSPTPAFTPAAVGVYRWRAFYSGDANNAAVSGPCGAANETSTVAKFTTTISTQATASATIGGSISDTATLAGGQAPTGTITFNAYGPNDATCSGAPAFTDPAAVSGNGTYTTNPAFTPAAVGTYRWIASYGGDATNAASSGACNDPNESSSVVQLAPPVVPLAAPVFPPNSFTVGPLRKRTLTVTLSSAGVLQIAASKLLKPSSASGGPGVVRIPLRLKKAANTKLKKKGKVKLAARITFTPTGGTAASQTAKLKIKNKKK